MPDEEHNVADKGRQVEKDRTTIRPARPPENPFAKYVGALPVFSGVHEVNAWIQTLRDEETQEQ